MSDRGFAGHELLIEDRVVIGQKVPFRLDEFRLGGIQCFLVGGVHRFSHCQERRRHEPAIGREHRLLALYIVGRRQQVVPARRLGLDQIRAVADAGGTPCVRNGEFVAGVVLQLHRFRVKVFDVLNFSVVDLRRQSELVQGFRERRGHEQHIIALAAACRDLAHDFFIGGVDGKLGFNSGIGLEAVKQILGHIPVPVRDDEFLSRLRLPGKRYSHDRERKLRRSLQRFHALFSLIIITNFVWLYRL